MINGVTHDGFPILFTLYNDELRELRGQSYKR